MFYEEDYEKDFESEGRVSVWLANFNSEQEMRAYMEEKTDENEDTYSDFYTEFRMGYLDYDFVDFIIHEEPVKSMEDLFRHVSYSVSIAQNMKEKQIDPSKYNTAICVFDFDFVPGDDYVRKNQNIDYIGSVEYDRDAGRIGEDGIVY